MENFLFGTEHIELHSSLGDLWVTAGFVGIALVLVFAILLLGVIGSGIATRTISGLVLFCVVQSFWNLFFNPFYSSAPVFMLALGLGLVLKSEHAGATTDSSEIRSGPTPIAV